MIRIMDREDGRRWIGCPGVSAAVAFDYSEQAADALLGSAANDARCEPEFFEASVRALLGDWLATVDADTGSADVAVRDPRLWLVFVTGPAYEARPPGLAINVYVAGRRWARAESEPTDDTSRSDAEHWNFVETWSMVLPAEGPWQLDEGTTQTLDQVIGYRFVSRRESSEEYEARTGATGAPPQAPRPGGSSSWPAWSTTRPTPAARRPRSSSG
jgi:hypothetical protein